MNARTLKALEIVRLAAELGDYDSNVIGMAAEIIAEEEFGMAKVPRGQKTIDGTWFVETNQRTIQVKAWSEKRVRNWGRNTFLRLHLENMPDDLLLLLICSSEPTYFVLYKGPAAEAGQLGNLRGRQVRALRLGKFMDTVPREVQVKLNSLLDLGE